MQYFKTLAFFLLGFTINSSLFFSTAVAQQNQNKANPKYKLILGIVVDQLRYDYLDRFERMFLPVGEKSGGFRKLKKLGASFKNCRYEHSATNTGPGHATFLSGCFPAKSGIVTNNWFDRSENRFMYCVEDSAAKPVGKYSNAKYGMRSPKNLLVQTLGDHLKAASPKSKVIGLAIKDRGAILPVGHKADAAFWFDAGSGKWISSSYYYPKGELPMWLKAFNDKSHSESYLGKTWNKLLPDKNYDMVDDVYGEGMIPGEKTRTFPHLIQDLSTLNDPRLQNSRRFDAILPTPFGDDLTTKLAKETILHEQLGQRNVTDLLTVSYSSLDYCGHIFGPMSQEIQDMTVRLDRQLDDLFLYIDSVIGLDSCLIVLTADHGVCPLPEFMDDGRRLNSDEVIDSLKIFIEERYPKIIQYFSKNEILLNHQIIEEDDLYTAEIESFVAKQTKRLSYVSEVFTRSDLVLGGLSGIGKLVLNSYHPNRNGDIYIVYKPHVIISKQTGTSHGTPHEYDRHVPLLLFGQGIKAGDYDDSCSPADIAPTLHHLLKLSPKASTQYDGRTLQEVLN